MCPFLIGWSRNFLELIKYLPFFWSIEVYIVKSKHFSFFKAEFGIFQLQAPGNSGWMLSFSTATHKNPPTICLQQDATFWRLSLRGFKNYEHTGQQRLIYRAWQGLN